MKVWRQAAGAALRAGALRATRQVMLAEAAEEWLAGARDGTIRNRSGDDYKQSTIRAYEKELQRRVLPVFGNAGSPTFADPTFRTSWTG